MIPPHHLHLSNAVEEEEAGEPLIASDTPDAPPSPSLRRPRPYATYEHAHPRLAAASEASELLPEADPGEGSELRPTLAAHAG